MWPLTTAIAVNTMNENLMKWIGVRPERQTMKKWKMKKRKKWTCKHENSENSCSVLNAHIWMNRLNGVRVHSVDATITAVCAHHNHSFPLIEEKKKQRRRKKEANKRTIFAKLSLINYLIIIIAPTNHWLLTQYTCRFKGNEHIICSIRHSIRLNYWLLYYCICRHRHSSSLADVDYVVDGHRWHWTNKKEEQNEYFLNVCVVRLEILYFARRSPK